MRCVKHKVIQQSLAEELIHHIALRNIIIHRHLVIDYEELYEKTLKLVEDISDLERSKNN